ncbi:hypothetical protein U27_04883 [Candidatus Vecturithrix granuli]|uniref:RXYLT1 C-terminal domain-containing protein n=1 Tax=Vecturithrix granuli TaxID=1499967 RepID=A0A081C006_VECG1|nr:hypothetical protein U27_04883 [Candidatus Vecturithrix granuli]
MIEAQSSFEGRRHPRILLLRSYSKAPFSATIARALRHYHEVEFMQYPPWPADRRVKLNKLYRADEAWEDLHTNLITNLAELSGKLAERYFDFAILVDDGAQLFQYQQLNFWGKCRYWLGFLRSIIRQTRHQAWESLQYDCSLPYSLAELRQYLPVVAIDISDAACLMPQNRRIFEESTLYFKRELPYDRFFLYYPDRPAPWSDRRKELLPKFEKIYGIPLGIEDGKYAQLKTQRKQPQDIDVFFAGEITNTLRKTAAIHLQELASNTSWNIVIKQSVPFREYCELIARSKITISIAGSRWECFRHYEAVALGSIPFMNKPTIDAVWWHSMPEQIFFENTFINFTSRIEQLLINESLRKACFKKLEQQVEQYMLHSKIVGYIINTSLEKLPCRPDSHSTNT